MGRPPADAETYIAVDSSDEHRLGMLCETFAKAKKPKFNIDHHISNTRYGDPYFEYRDHLMGAVPLLVLAAFAAPTLVRQPVRLPRK